jgi:hypothetical protein
MGKQTVFVILNLVRLTYWATQVEVRWIQYNAQKLAGRQKSCRLQGNVPFSSCLSGGRFLNVTGGANCYKKNENFRNQCHCP